MIHGAGDGDIAPGPAEHHGELCLPVELGAAFGHHHLIMRAVDGTGRGEHKHGLRGGFHACLCSMLAIGQRAAHDFARAMNGGRKPGFR